MNFDEIAELWQQSAPEENQVIEVLARRASRWGRLLEYAEYAMTGLFVLAVAIAFLLAPAPRFLLVGGVAIFVAAWVGHKRHLLSQIERALDTSGREAFIASAVASVEASLKQSMLSTIGLLPAVLLGGLLKYTFGGGTIAGYFETLPERIAGTAQQALPVILLFALFLYLLRSTFRLRSELARLRLLAHEYARESDLDRSESLGLGLGSGLSPSQSTT